MQISDEYDLTSLNIPNVIKTMHEMNVVVIEIVVIGRNTNEIRCNLLLAVHFIKVIE